MLKSEPRHRIESPGQAWSARGDHTRNPALDAVTIAELLRQHAPGGAVFVSYQDATACLRALGVPVTLAMVKTLTVVTGIIGGRSVGALADFEKAARAMPKRRLERPNLKAASAARARTAKAVAA